MGVVLNLSQELYIDASAASAEVVACKVDEHYVFGIFFLVDKQSLGKFMVTCIVSGALECAGYRVNVGVMSADAQMSFG